MNEAGVRKIASKLGVKFTGVNGPWLQGHCPLAPYTHARGTDNDPSFAIMVNDEGISYFNCFSCKHTGRVSTLIRMLGRYHEENYDPLIQEAEMLEATKPLPDYDDLHGGVASIAYPEPLNEAAYGDLYMPWRDDNDAREYLEYRNVSEEAADLLDIRYDEDELRVVFPVRDVDGYLYGYTGRSILEDDQKPAGYRGPYPKVRDYAGLPKEFLLLGENLFQPGKPLLVVEGLFGLASLVSVGVREICNPVALMGSKMTRHKANLLADLGEPVYLLPDDDTAGDACLYGPPDPNGPSGYKGGGAIDLLKGNVPLFVPIWPRGKDDPDQLDFTEVEELLADAPPY